MSGHLSWRPLPVSRPDLPALLVSTSFTSSPASSASYTVQITDLANMWSESLERKAIYRRSLQEDTSIDPSEDEQNMRTFLDYIRAAFDPSDDEHQNTSLILSVGDDAESRRNAGDDGLVLHITCILPSSFTPLKWPMYLKKCPASTLTTQLVLPLLQAQHARAREIDALVAALRDKDTVICKMGDKLEALNVGLETIFTSLSNRRKATQAQAEERVKGLALFDEDKFRGKMDKAHNGGRSSDDGGLPGLPGLIKDVFGGTTGLTYQSDSLLVDDDALPLNDWWRKLRTGSPPSPVPLVERRKGKEKETAPAARKSRAETPTPTPTPPRPAAKPSAKSAAADQDTDEDDGDFQVQSTPPHLQSARKRDTNTRPTTTKTTAGDDETTEDDTDEPSLIPDSYPPPAQPRPSPRKLGGLGGLRKKKAESPLPPPADSATPTPTPTPSPSPSPPPPKPTPVAADDESTASETESEPPSPPPPPKPAPARKGGLGRLGGLKGKTATPTPEPDSQGPSSRHSSPAKPRGKLGQLGGLGGPKRSTPSSSQAESSMTATAGDGDVRGRPVDKMDVDEEPKAPRETSQDRADRKRAELQAELDRKKAAAPARKKRKF